MDEVRPGVRRTRHRDGGRARARDVFTGTTAGAGAIQLVCGATTITAPLAGGETAAQCATKLLAAVSGGSYPFTAAIDSTLASKVNLLFAPDRDVRRYSCAIVSTTGVTVDVSSGGTVGQGQPSPTAARANLLSTAGFAGWAVPFTGTQANPDTTTLSTIAQHVELRANGVNQQEQRVHACVTWPASIAGSVPIATAPALTSSPRYAFMWCQDLGVQGFELACRMAAARVNNDYPAKNWDGYLTLSQAVEQVIGKLGLGAFLPLLGLPAVLACGCDWQPLGDSAQTGSVFAAVALVVGCGLALAVLGHQDCSPMRRCGPVGGWDPGRSFSWSRLRGPLR